MTGPFLPGNVRLSHLAVLSATAAVAMDGRAGTPLYYAGLAVTGAVIIAALLLPARSAAYALLALITIAPDLTQSAVDIAAGGGAASATVWQLRLGSLSGAYIVLGIATVLALRLPRPRFSLPEWLFVLYFGVVAVIVSYRFGFLTDSAGPVLTDAKLPVFLLVSLMVFAGYARAYPDEVPRLLQVAVVLLAVRAGVDLLYLIAGVERTLLGDVNRVSVDSAKGLVVVPAFLALHHWLHGRRKALAATVFFVAALLLIVYQTRFLLVTFALGLLLAAGLLRGRTALGFALATPVLGYLLVAIVSVTMPDVARTAWVRLLSLRDESGSIQVDIDRYAAIVNTTRTLSRNGAWLTGMGYGAWYTDRDFRFLTVDESAFQLEAYRTGRFPRVHDFAFHVLFKHGIVGIVVYLVLFAVPGTRVFRAYRRAPPWIRTVSFVTIAALPTIVLTLYWTGKGLMLAGGTVATLRWLAGPAAASAHGKET